MVTREKKFRAWHEENKEFIYFTLQDFFINGVECSASKNYQPKKNKDGYILPTNPNDFSDSFTLHAQWEQYTNLQDKNDVEIYENDIVETDHHRKGVIQFTKSIFGINWDCDKNPDPEWKDGNLYGGWGAEHNLRRLDDGFNKEIMIIGNIHENPELVVTEE